MDVLHDLTQIVDRLAAAREALAPASAALAIKHAQFGEISLRFDQQQDGRLTAEIASPDAETHRAIAHAVATERGQGGEANTSASSSQQQGGQPLRGQTAERDSAGSQGEQRQEQARQRGGKDTAQQARPGGGQPGDGVFA